VKTPASIATLIFVLFCLVVTVKYCHTFKAPDRWHIIMYDGNEIEVFVDYGDSTVILNDYQKLHPVWMVMEKQ